MKIEKNSVVSIEYTLKSDDGKIIDSNKGRGPLEYMQGHGNLIPGLEKELLGKKVGDTFNVVIPPEEAYGIQSDKLTQVIKKEQFQNSEEVKVGAQFQVQSGEEVRIATVTSIDKEDVTLDLNHPLAGQTLHFDVEVKNIREASAEELDHGHVHGEHGHQH